MYLSTALLIRRQLQFRIQSLLHTSAYPWRSLGQSKAYRWNVSDMTVCAECPSILIVYREQGHDVKSDTITARIFGVQAGSGKRFLVLSTVNTSREDREEAENAQTTLKNAHHSMPKLLTSRQQFSWHGRRRHGARWLQSVSWDRTLQFPWGDVWYPYRKCSLKW